MSKQVSTIYAGMLADYFDEAAFKILAQVDIISPVSNQHEWNGVAALKKLFGTQRCECPVVFTYLHEEESRISSVEGMVTWYDSREKSSARTGRSEYRLYYPSNDVTREMKAGDLLVIAKKGTDFHIFIAEKFSVAEQQLLWMFGTDREHATSFEIKEFAKTPLTTDTTQNLVSRFLLDTLGITPKDADEDYVSKLQDAFHNEMPDTDSLLQFVIDDLKHEIDPIADPDETVLKLFYKQEIFYKTLERNRIVSKLNAGFEPTDPVQDFINFSLSVQNARKSRAGTALERQLCFIFDTNEVRYSYNKITERPSKPDFIFPSIEQYHTPEFPASKLFMLASKSTCKDRWRQVLAEAARISHKHLFTLEPRISVNQTTEMINNNLTLVLPTRIKQTYTSEQQKNILSLRDFIALVK